jgi:predicted DNA-binding transcriptional regulator YafY
LVAADVGSADIKVYRLNRADELTPGERSGAFTTPHGFDPADAVLHHPWEAGRDLTVASVVFDEPVAWIAERELGPNTAIDRGADGSITATVEIAAPSAFLGWLIGFGADAEIIEPPELRRSYLSLVGEG